MACPPKKMGFLFSFVMDQNNPPNISCVCWEMITVPFRAHVDDRIYTYKKDSECGKVSWCCQSIRRHEYYNTLSHCVCSTSTHELCCLATLWATVLVYVLDVPQKMRCFKLFWVDPSRKWRCPSKCKMVRTLNIVVYLWF